MSESAAIAGVDRRTVLGSMAAACAGCAQPADDASTLVFWAMGSEGEAVGELLRAFEAEHPGVRVVSQTLPWTAAHERLLTAFVGNSLPDVTQLGNTWIAEFASLQALEPLDARRQASDTINPEDYFEGVWRTNLHGGQLYGVPWYVDTRVLFYRRDLLDAAGFSSVPQTWAQWREAIEGVKRVAGEGNYGIFLPLNEFEPLLMLGLQQEEPLLREQNTRGNFESEGFKNTLRFYQSMFEDGLAPPATNTQISNAYTEFDRGYFSFYITGPWNIGQFKARLPQERQHIWATSPLPGPAGPGASSAGGASLVITRRSRRKELAWALVEYLSRPEVQTRFYELTGDLPPRRSAWASTGLEQDPYARAFLEQLERARPTPPVPEWERIADELRIVGELLARGEMNVDQAAAALNARADRILEKRRWMVAQGRAV
jgi:multiple sugar transport system substrate-binding protein